MIGNKSQVIKWLVDQPDGKMYRADFWHEKRSINANSYYWSLLSRLAQVLRTSKEELHEQMLDRYGVIEGTVITMRADIPIRRLGGHWRLMKSDGKWSAYIQLTRSSEMDTREFSALLDGLISDCKEAGIETIPESELRRLRGYEQKDKGFADPS